MDCIKIIAIYLFLFLPNIIDFILTFLDYNDYKGYLDSESSVINYFIIRFIYQGIYVFYFLSLMTTMTYMFSTDFLLVIIFLVLLIIILIFEIISLVFYIRVKDDITFLAKIGYIIHFLNAAETCIICYKNNKY